MSHTVTELQLKNGAKGLLVHIPEATVMTIEINFRAGEYLVDTPKWETPHIMEHLLLGANKRIPKARIFQAEFEKNGAYCNASTSAYDITYEAECADFEWERILDLMLVAITDPLFLDEEFDAEVGNVREELTGRANNHFRHLSLALREAFGLCALTDKERLELMQNVTLTDVKKHYERTHTADNMRFILAGNFPSKRRIHIKNVLEDIALPVGTGRLDLPQEIPQKLEKVLFIPNKTVDNIHFYLDTFHTGHISDPEFDALLLVNSMLTETLYSRILGTARERGLVYGMSSSAHTGKFSTNWWFGTQVSVGHAPALFDIIIREIEKVRAGDLSAKDIDDAKQYSLGRYQRSGQTVGGIAGMYAGRYFYEDIIHYYQDVPKHIKAITKKRIVDTSKVLFADDIWGLGVLGGNDRIVADMLHAQASVLW